MKLLTLIAASIILLTMSLTPAHAVTCEDLRRLTAAERDYWSQVLNLTSAQRHKIWLECYRHYSHGPRNFGTRGLLRNVSEASEL